MHQKISREVAMSLQRVVGCGEGHRAYVHVDRDVRGITCSLDKETGKIANKAPLMLNGWLEN